MREIGNTIRDVADTVEQHMAVMETSELYKTGTELRLNLQQRYDEESALPQNRNDPHFGDRFMAEVGPQIDQWGKGAGTEHGKMLAATLGAQIRNEIFNHVAAGQSEMDSAHVVDNVKQTGNMLGSGLITDPSEPNFNRSLGTMTDAIDGMTMAIPDVAMRERIATELRNEYLPNLVIARYNGVAESIKNQIAQTGGDTSPAKDQLDKDIKSQLGFQYLTPEQQIRLTDLGDEAVKRGQEMFRSKDATAKAQMTEQGKAAFAEIHTALTALALKGQGPTPDILDAIGRYSRIYGPTNPGEVASLDDYAIRGQDRAQEGKVEPFNQQTRDNIQAGMSLPSGDPRRPTLASITKAWSNGQITKEDLRNYTEVLSKLDKPETDPTFKPAWENFTRWQNQMIQSIGNKGDPGAAAARAQFLHDSTSNFMSRGRYEGNWDKALDDLTNVKNQHNFSQVIHFYQKAAEHSDASGWLQANGLKFDPDGTVTPARGSAAAPIYPTANHPTQSQAPASADEVKKADEIIWGKH